MMQTDKKQDGFSLIEVAVAMSTIAVLSFGVMFGFTISSSQDKDAYEFGKSQAACQEVIELAESYDYEDLIALIGNPEELPEPAGNNSMLRIITVVPIEQDLIAIQASVENRSNGQYRVIFTTLKTMKQEAL